MDKERISTLANICIIASFGAVIAYIGLKILLPAVMPFLIGYSIALITKRPSAFISEKTGVNKKFLRASVSLLLMLLIVGGVIFAISKLAVQAWEFFTSISEDGSLGKIISFLVSPIDNFIKNSGVSSELESKIYSAVSGMLSDAVSKLAVVITAVIGAVPKIVLFVFVTAISTIYFAIDIENVNKYVQKILPGRISKVLSKFKDTTFSVCIKYLRSYFLIMVLTFSIVIFGLSILRVKYALLMASIIAVLDLLPIVGVGIVLVPWSLFVFMLGDVKLGVGLIILYIATTVTREIAEPRIVGRELGIHPLLTLILMYVGYSLFGFFGLIILPAFSVILSAYGKRKTSDGNENHATEIKE